MAGWVTDRLLYTSLFAACCAVGMTMGTERLINNAYPALITPLHAFIAGSTLMVYNAHYLIKKSSPEVSDRYGWTQHHRIWNYSFFAAGVLMCTASLFFLSWKILAACVVLGVLSFAYSLPLLPIEKKRLKDFGWIKIFVLTSVWTIVTAILPILYWDKALSAFPLEILIRFVFMFTLCVAFDIRDMQTDLDAGIYTLPNTIGITNSYRLMNATLILFVLLSIVQYIRYPAEARLAGELITAAATKTVIVYTRRHPSDKAYLGLVDGMMLLYALLVLAH